MKKANFRHASATEIADALDSGADVSIDDLRVVLINAMERIASLEKDRDGLEQLFRVFNEQVEAAELHGPGVLDEQ